MCGIIGYIGPRDGVDVAREGLRRLEYRGYDSAGIAVVRDSRVDAVRSPGKLAALEDRLAEHPLAGSPAIGHTRWATHGAPTERNAHPHVDTPGRIAVAHNGIIENHRELRDWLGSNGAEFRSETDSETIAHLIRHYYEGDLAEAVRRALADVRGAYAIVVMSAEEPDVLVAARKGSPLVLGLGEDEQFVASDVSALLSYTRSVVYMGEGEVAEVRRSGCRLRDLDGRDVPLSVQTIEWDQAAAEKGGYPHFMLKEIYEQPEVLRNTLRGRISPEGDAVVLEKFGFTNEDFLECPRLVFVACGTALHAAMVGRYLFETFARLPVDVELASEFRYRDLALAPGTVVIPVSQSGETADTLEAIRVARHHGARILGVVNAVGSSITREADSTLYLNAGLEIGVASTKAYTAMIAAISLLSIHVGRLRGCLTPEQTRHLLGELQAIPDKVHLFLDSSEAQLKKLGQDPRYTEAKSALYLARSYNTSNAFEGALKLKEISYIHAEGCAAGEMKHGPIALVDEHLPVICVCPKSRVYEKMLSNIQEIRARQGIVLSIATEGDLEIAQHSDDVVYIPDCPEPFSPILAAIPMQLFAYYVAVHRGCDVDQPRNLAKSVTVE